MTVYLSGSVRANLPEGVGVMITPMMGNKLPDDRIWAADTGMFAAPEKFDGVVYLNWLANRKYAVDRNLFATAPDAWGDSQKTLKLALPFLPIIRAMGYRAAFVAQDGLSVETAPWDDFDVLFIGGSNPYRSSTLIHDLIMECKRRDKGIHLGRVNSSKRLMMAHSMGIDSADGTFVAFGPDQNVPKVAEWVKSVKRQPRLEMS